MTRDTGTAVPTFDGDGTVYGTTRENSVEFRGVWAAVEDLADGGESGD
jgi:hypothetical protein